MTSTTDPAASLAVQAGPLRPAIYLGRLDRARRVFTYKRDATDEVLAAVAQYVQRNYPTGMEMTFTDPEIIVTVTVREADR